MSGNGREWREDRYDSRHAEYGRAPRFITQNLRWFVSQTVRDKTGTAKPNHLPFDTGGIMHTAIGNYAISPAYATKAINWVALKPSLQRIMCGAISSGRIFTGLLQATALKLISGILVLARIAVAAFMIASISIAVYDKFFDANASVTADLPSYACVRA